MYVIKLNKTEQLYKIFTVNVQTNKNELLWYMFMWPPVYIKYTHLSLSYCLGVFQVYNRWCVCVCVCVCVWRKGVEIPVTTSDWI